MTTTPAVWKSPFVDNATDNGFAQDSGVVAATTLGDFFSVWRDSGNFNSGHSDIVARHFDSLGNPKGPDTSLLPLNNEFGLPFNASQPAAAMQNNNVLAVAFTDLTGRTGTDSHVYVVLTNGSLNPSLIDGSTSVTNHPSITSFADGKSVVSYTIQNSATDWDIMARVVGSGGGLGRVFTLFNDTDRSDLSDLATLKNDNFVAVFESQFQGSPTDLDVFFTITSEQGATQGSALAPPQTIVAGAGTTATETHPHVAALNDGGFVVTWTDSAGDVNGTSQGIRASIYDASGNLVHGNFLVNQFNQAGDQDSSDVTALPDGGFVVAWADIAAGTDRVQRFDQDGNLVGTPVSISNQATSDVNAATLADGRSIFTIDDSNSGNSNTASSILDTRTTVANQVTGANFIGAGNSPGDILLTHNVNGVQQLEALQIENANINNHVDLGAIPVNQNLSGTGDFNHDGLSDLLITADDPSANTRTLLDDQMQPGGSLTQFSFGAVGPDWIVDGIGDFNHDGTSDILMHNDIGAARTLEILSIQNHTVQSAPLLGPTGTDWVVDGVGDFNGDGTSDILQHLIASDGTMTFRILSMNNNAVQSVATLGAIGADFQVDGIGDFNGDHTSDILLHHDANGVRTYEIIPMVNNTPQAPAFLGPLATFFSLDGIGDFNGDGTSDIALHFDTLQFGGPVRTIEIDTIVNNAVQQSNPLGPTGVDFHVG